MDAGRQNMEEMRAESSWMPETPFKNGLERPPVFWPYPGQQSQEPDQANCELEVAYGTKMGPAGRGMGACTVSAKEEGARSNVPFQTLIAMVESGSGSGNGTANVRTPLLHSNPSNSQKINYDHGPGYDLNLSHESMEEAFYSEFTHQFAPITPEKPVMRDQSEVARRQSSFQYNGANEVLTPKENQRVAAEVLVNVLQNDKLPQNSATDSTLAATSPPSENHIPLKEGEGGDVENLIKTPQQRPRKKKHRPKVITEGTPRPRKQAAAKPVESKEKPTVKRKYVRKNASSKTSTTPVTGEATNQTISEPAKKSCRRSLNFDMEGEHRDYSIDQMPRTEQEQQDNAGGNRSKSIVHLSPGIEVIVNNTRCGIAFDFNYSVSQLIRDYSSPAENQVAGTQTKVTDIRRERGHVYTFKSKNLVNVLSEEHLLHIKSQTHSKLRPQLPKSSNCCTGATFRTEQTAKDPMRTYVPSIQQSNIFSTNSVGSNYNSLFVYNNGDCWGQFQKKKRTEKGQRAASTTTASFVQQCDTSSTTTASFVQLHQHAEKPNAASVGKENGHCSLNESCAVPLPNWKEKSMRQKFRGRPTSVQNMASMADSAWFNTSAAHSAGQLEQVGNSHGHQPFVKDLAELMRYTFAKKKRTKSLGSIVNFAPSCRIEENQSGNILFKQGNFSAKTSGIQVETARKKLAVDGLAAQSVDPGIIERTNAIDYAAQNALVPYDFANKQNELVPYRQDGTIVPYYGPFAPIKKRPRAKVDLDDETNRVWKLLLGNINSEGIDGTDPETAKRWEEDRNVFRGRALSFIARMHLVQGDRRFSPWKGSVMDSVIGVFLTQNVSDHLSSSAFMSLAARFPVNSRPCCEGDTSSVNDKALLCLVDPETAKSNEMPNHSISDQSSMTLHCTEFDEEKESVNGEELSGSSTGIINSQNSTETSGESIKNVSHMEAKETGQTYCLGERKGASDVSSCQNSAVSSQNSIDAPISLADERAESFSENNLQTMDRIGGHMKGSFLELLQIAETTTLHDYSMGNANFSSNLNIKNRCNYSQSLENDLQTQQMKSSDHLRGSKEGSAIPFSDCHVHSSSFGAKEIEDVQIITEEARYSRISEDKGTNFMKDYTASTEESASHFSHHNKLNIIVQEASKHPFVHYPSFNNAQKGSHTTMEAGTSQMEDPKIFSESLSQAHNCEMPQSELFSNQALDVMESSNEFNDQVKDPSKISIQSKGKELQDMEAAKRKAKIRRVGNDIRENVDWDSLKRETEAKSGKRKRTADTMDSVDWEAVRRAKVDDIANAIKERGMNNILAGRIKEFLDRMVREHGSIDLEWLRDVEPDTAKEYLLSVRGLGLKSVECVRLLTLHHLAFPVDTNVARIAVRLGWVPLQPLPESLQLHLLELYPVMESIQKYLWPRLCKLDQKTLYEFHYQLITFGKVFCTKSKPNCNACPMRGECRHFASAFASARLSLPAPEEKGIVSATENRAQQYPPMVVNPLFLPPPLETQQMKDNGNPEANQQLDSQFRVTNCNPIIEEPSSPEPAPATAIEDIEDMFLDDPDEIPTIKLNIEEFTQNLQDFMHKNMELQEADMSKALVALTAEAASIPTPKLKNVSRLRTEHHVYELPDSHPLLQELDTRETDDPSPYLLAIWTPGETADSIQPPQESCCAQEYGKLCDEKTCYSCNSTREANSQIVRGTILIPCRTAMRGSFPLNGTYFQVNEVFADHDSSLKPIDVPRNLIWDLPRRTVYFGTSVPSIFKGLTTEEIQHCFWRGYVCVRGFDQKTRAPKPLMARLHFPVSKLPKNKEKTTEKQKKT